MRKVLFIIARLGIAGGEQRSLTLLCNELVRQGAFDVTVAALESDPPTYQLDARVHFVNLVDVKKSRGARFAYLLTMIRNLGIDLVVGYGISSRLPVGIIGCLVKAPIVFCERMYPERGKGYPLGTRMIQALGVFLMRGRSVVFQSHAVVGCYKKLARHAVIPNMLSAEIMPEVAEWGARGNVVLNAARCVPEKNQAMLVRAFVAAREGCPQYKLEIYGEGKQEKALTALVNELGAGDFVEIRPTSPKIFMHMNSAKIYVCSTNAKGEGYSNALLEAMAMGMACISTNCSGSVEDLIEDGVNGLIVPPGDEEAMTDALVSLMGDDALAQRLGQRAAEVRASNAKERVVGQWVAFFCEVIDEK